MYLDTIAKGANQIRKVAMQNSPTILTSLAVGGLITSVGLAIKATPKAMQLIEEEKALYFDEHDDLPKLTKLDVLKITWKCYIPTAVMGVASIGCIIGANTINLRRNAALASVYSITEAALKEYQEKVVETIGKNKEQKIRDDIAQDTLNRNPIDNREIFVTDKGSTLCYDALSGRYFLSDVDLLKKVQNDFNHSLLTDWSKTLNEYYSDIGLEEINMGRDIGWTSDHMLELRFSAKLCSNGKPCVVINYAVEPCNL